MHAPGLSTDQWLSTDSVKTPLCDSLGLAENTFCITLQYSQDASFLLTVEVFLLTVRLFYLRWGNRKQKRPNPISGQGEP